MEFQCWESRNLARCVLSETFHKAVHHQTSENKSSSDLDEDDVHVKFRPLRKGRLLARERLHRGPTRNIRFQSEFRPIPHYRRFARSISLELSSSATSSSSDDHHSRPVYRRFSRSVHAPPVSASEDESSIVVWPASGRMNAFLGKAKIEEFIRKFSDKIKCTIDFKCILRLKGIDRYKYSSVWSNEYFSSRIYFTIDASSVDDYIPVSMTYSLADGKQVHRPTSAEAHVQRFIKNLDPKYPGPNSHERRRKQIRDNLFN